MHRLWQAGSRARIEGVCAFPATPASLLWGGTGGGGKSPLAIESMVTSLMGEGGAGRVIVSSCPVRSLDTHMQSSCCCCHRGYKGRGPL
jgi:hypothetical protein